MKGVRHRRALKGAGPGCKGIGNEAAPIIDAGRRGLVSFRSCQEPHATHRSGRSNVAKKASPSPLSSRYRLSFLLTYLVMGRQTVPWSDRSVAWRIGRIRLILFAAQISIIAAVYLMGEIYYRGGVPPTIFEPEGYDRPIVKHINFLLDLLCALVFIQFVLLVSHVVLAVVEVRACGKIKSPAPYAAGEIAIILATALLSFAASGGVMGIW